MMNSEEYREQLKQRILEMFDQLPPDLQEKAVEEIKKMITRHIMENGVEVDLGNGENG